jgi:hypothetical protein
MRDINIALLYMALPSAILTATGGVFLLVYEYIGAHTDSMLHKAAAICVAVLFIGSGGWAAKEFLRPTKRRTPQWLRSDPWYDQLRNR